MDDYLLGIVYVWLFRTPKWNSVMNNKYLVYYIDDGDALVKDEVWNKNILDVVIEVTSWFPNHQIEIIQIIKIN